LKEKMMLNGIDEISSWARQDFGIATPRLFPQAMSGQVFDLPTALSLYGTKSYRRGFFSPGHEMITVVRNLAIVGEEEYWTMEGAHRLTQEGATIVYRLIQFHLPRVEELCQEVADAVGLPTFASGYLTPPGRQGYPLHADADSILCIQQHGSKTWALYSPKAKSVLDPKMAWIHESPGCGASPPVEEASYVFTLERGDVAVIPRGWSHYAVAGEGAESSLELCVGLLHPEIGVQKIEQQHPVWPRVAA
jgi:hypothetical protein